MFQYAMGLSLEEAMGRPSHYDLSEYKREHNHNGFELETVFGVQVRTASNSEIRKTLGWARFSIIRKLLKCTSPGRVLRFKYKVESAEGLQAEIPNESLYWDGYWQSERYFKNVAKKIAEVFTFREVSGIKNRSIAAEVGSTESVAVHVRRGDYVKNPIANKYHGTCSAEYYDTARIIIEGIIKNPSYYIFSDDIKWAKCNLRYRNSQFIENNAGSDSWIDMALMAKCRYQIIANSTFSWWAAWLNPFDGKIVVGPDRWFATADNTQASLHPILPENWIKAPNR